MTDAVTILEKLRTSNSWDFWTVAERKAMLEIYCSICKKEANILSLVYSYHNCEDIYRDFDMRYLKDKINDVNIALQELSQERLPTNEKKV